MSDQTNFIKQIHSKEQESVRILSELKEENNKKVAEAEDISTQVILSAELKAKEKAKEYFLEKKEEAKMEYKNILVSEGNYRRDIIEGAKLNLDKTKKYLKESFLEKFNSQS